MPVLIRITARDLIVPFLALCVAVVIYGMTATARALVEAILGVVASAVRHVPFIGGLADSAVNRAIQSITHALGSVASAEEEAIGRYFHKLGDVIESTGEAIWLIAQELYTLSHVSVLVDDLKGVYHRVYDVNTVTRVIRETVKPIVKTVTVTVPATVGTVAHTLTARVAAIAATLGHAIAVDLPNLWQRERVLTDQLSRLWKWTRAHGKQLAEGAGLGAVAVALSRLGLGWLRCNNVGKAARAICRTDVSLLEDLLLGTLAIFGALSVREFARGMVEIEDEALTIARSMIREWPS